MKKTIKTNGYRAYDLQDMIAIFERACDKTFINCKIVHFYYGNELDMITVTLENGHYGYFNLTKNRVSFNGHTCSVHEYIKFTSLTKNDECFAGRLLEIALS